MHMSNTHDHRSYQEVLMTGLTRATGAQATMSPAPGPCGPVSQPGAVALYVLINGVRIPVQGDQIGVGPSHCPDGTNHVYMHHAWHKVISVAVQAPHAKAPNMPTAPVRTALPNNCVALPPTSRRMHADHPQGLSALFFGPTYTIVSTEGGTPFRQLLAVACRSALQEVSGEGIANAFAAMSMGRIQYLGNAAQPEEGATPSRPAPTRVRLASLPTAYKHALMEYRHLVGKFVRKTLGWHVIFCENGEALPATAAPSTPSNRFALFEEDGPDANTGEPARQDSSAVPVSPSGPPPPPTVDALTGTVVCKRFRGKPFYAVATYKPEQELPFVYEVVYTDGDRELMCCQEVKDHKVGTWKEVPQRFKKTLKRLGGKMRNHTAPPAVPLNTHDGAIMRKRFGGRWYYGVATFMPLERPPYVYTITYEDSDSETMTFTEVSKCVVHSFDMVPTDRHARLIALGGKADGQPHVHRDTAAPQGDSGECRQPTLGANQGQQRTRTARLTAQQQQRRAANKRRRRRAAGRLRMANLAWCAQGLKVGYVNVCGMTQLKAAELQGMLGALNLDILAVVETWEGRCQVCSIPGYVFISKPRQGGSGGGVGFYVSNSIAPLVSAHTHTHVPEALWLELSSTRRGGAHVMVGAVYLPPSTLDNRANIQSVYSALQMDIEAFKQKGEVIVLGDLNSKVGKASCAGDHIGEWGEDEPANDAGQALIDMLKATDMYTLNGRHPSPSAECHTPQYTRARLVSRADGSIEAQYSVLDYILAPKDWALPTNSKPAVSSIQVEAQKCISGSDHLLLWCIIPHTIDKQHVEKHTRRKANIHLLITPGSDRLHHQANYQQEVEGSLQGYLDLLTDLAQQVNAGTMSADSAVNQAKAELVIRVHHAVERSIGFRGPSNKAQNAKRPPVYTKEVRNAVRNRDQTQTNLLNAQVVALADPTNADVLQEAQAAVLLAQKNVKAAVAKARASITDKHIDDVFECDSRHDSKGVWRGLQRLGGKQSTTSSNPRALQGPDGSLVMGDQQIADVLAAQFERATNPETFAANACFDDLHKKTIEAEVSAYRTSTSRIAIGPDELSAPITFDEVDLQCRRLHNQKAPSPLDDVNNELLKYGGHALTDALTSFFDLQFQLETKSQTTGVIKALYKKDDPTVASNYRPITLGSALDKLYNMVLNDRICRYLEANNGLHEAQQGFRQGRSTIDNIFMLNQCLNARMKENLTTFLMFVDIEKAYDSVWRPGLLWHLWQKGIQGKLFRVLAQMTDSPTSIVLHNGTFSSPFKPGMGWEQGDTLATTMFNIFVDSVLQEVWQSQHGLPLSQHNDSSFAQLIALMYADDMVGMTDSHAAMQALINTTKAALTRWRLKASVKPTDGSKTAVMVVRGGTMAARQRAAKIGPAQVPPFMWGDITIPQVRSYRYLGVWYSDVGTWEEHMRIRKEKADAAAHAQHGVLYQARLSWRLRKLTLTAVVQPVLTYAAQVWHNHTKAHRAKLDSWQMQLLRRMCHCPPNTSAECLQQELGITPTHVVCDISALTYWHHLRTLSSDRLLHQVHQAWGTANQPWQQNISKLLAEYDIDPALTSSCTKKQFAAYVKTKAAQRVQQLWTTGSRTTSTTLQRYRDTYGPGIIAQHKPAAREYIEKLSQMRRGHAAELCMKLRLECLPLRAMHSHRRQNETSAQQAQRELCPVCNDASETAAHFLLECSAYTACRNTLFTKLQKTVPDALAVIQAGSANDTWRLLLKDDVLGNDDTVQEDMADTTNALTEGGSAVTAMKAVADFVCDAWKLRSTALAGRGTNEGDLMV